MSAAPFMQLYIADYLGDTQHLTTEQHGAYLLLLMAMWRCDGVLPNDPAKLARIARVSPRRWPAMSGDVMAFFDVEGDFITQKRLVEERKKAVSISEKRSASGKIGGMSKALKTNNAALANAKQMPKHSQISEEEREANASPKKKTGVRLTEDWRLSKALGEWAVSEGMPEGTVRTEADRFRDYWVSKPGKDGVKLDWAATWRNWVRKWAADEARHGSRRGASQPNPDRQLSQWEYIAKNGSSAGWAA